MDDPAYNARAEFLRLRRLVDTMRVHDDASRAAWQQAKADLEVARASYRRLVMQGVNRKRRRQ